MKKYIIDDGFQAYLTEGAALVGSPGIPMLVNMHNTVVPADIIPFEKCRREQNRRKYVHFYMHDKGFANVLTSTKHYVDLLRTYDGVLDACRTSAMSSANKYIFQSSSWRLFAKAGHSCNSKYSLER